MKNLLKKQNKYTKTKLLCVIFLLVTYICNSQTTVIPDANFEQALIDLGHDSGAINGTVPTANISSITTLDVSGRSIASLVGIEDFSSLERLYCDNNQLTNLDISQNTNLEDLNCNYTQLTILDTNNNAALKSVYAIDSQLISVDISNNPLVTSLVIPGNHLIHLNVKNGNNHNFTNFSTVANPNLICIEVDDIVYATTNWSNDIDSQTNFGSCFTDIPDSNFEQALIDLGIDFGTISGAVPTVNINSITSLNLDQKSITDLTGIEGFTSLTYLDCSFNDLVTLNLSNNTALIELNASQAMVFPSNQNTINISQNTSLAIFIGNSNGFQNLDVSQNINLTELWCNYNELTSLDLSQNTLLENIYAFGNQLTNLDLSNNSLLQRIECNNNILENLNVKNGNNSNVSSFSAQNNPNLTCIEVDNVTYSNTNWTNIDAASNFSGDCGVTYIPDPNFEQALIDLNLDSGAINGVVTTSNIASITQLEVYNKNITNLRGIEDFIVLTNLRCENNQITNLDLSQNTNLNYLSCQNNQLTSFDVAQNTGLLSLNCGRNQLTSLDVSQNTALTSLTCIANQLTSLDVSQNTGLLSLATSGNPLTSIDVSQNTTLTSLFCALNQLTSIDLSQNTSLERLHCGDNQLTTINVSLNTALKTLDCENNQLTNLELSQNTNLVSLDFKDNLVTSIDLSQQLILSYLYCRNNQLTSLNTTQNTALIRLSARINQLTHLDVSQNTALTNLSIDYNQLTSLDLSQNTSLERLDVTSNQLTSLDLSQNTSLDNMQASSNQLTSLNIKNGNNFNMTSNSDFSVSSNPNLTCIEVDNVAFSTSHWFSNNNNYSTDCGYPILLSTKVYLQGAILNPNTGEETVMRDDLRVSNYIPTTSPYTDVLICNANVFTTTGNNAIVDWVWVELRDKTDNTIVIDSQSALLQRDGDVVDIDGVSPLTFSQPTDDYYVVVNHRNHLGIMTVSAVTLGISTTLVDLSADPIVVLGGTNAVQDIGNGIYAMQGGDFNDDGQVLNTDITAVLLLTGTPGYSKADSDMNGQILNTDITLIIQPNSGKGQQY